jgi:serine/threonine protein kinase
VDLTPYFSAVSQLYTLTGQAAESLAAPTFFQAVSGFYDALSPQYIPGFPQTERDKVRDLILQIQCLSSPETIAMVCAKSFVRDMRQMRLMPSRENQENEELVREMLQRFLDRSMPSPEATASRMEGGGIRFHSHPNHRQTIRGDFVGDTLMTGALLSDGFHIGRVSQIPDIAPAVDELRRTTVSEPEALPPPPEVPVKTPSPDVKRLEAALAEAEAARQKSISEAHDRVWKSITEGPFPLTEPKEGRLLVKGGVYLSYAQEMYDVVIGSLYKLVEKLDEGGSGVVHVAEEIGTNRRLAVKIVKKDLPEERERHRAAHRKELELQPLLKADCFVHSYTHGETADGDPYIVMDLMEGGSLADWLTEMRMGRRKLSTSEVKSILLQLVACVAESHKRGLVHRDVKPENFFMSQSLPTMPGYDQHGWAADIAVKVKLGDFGIAQKLEKIAPRPSDVFFGTAGYVPPEIANPQGPTCVDTSGGDVWALGVTAYELLTRGQFPFEGDSATAIILSSSRKDPPPPSQVRKDSDIPPALDRIVQKALAKDPKNRHVDASDLLYELLTYEADALVEEAEASLRRSMTTNADLNIHRDEWREKIQEALRLLRSVYDQYPHPRILATRIKLNYELFRWADRSGDVELTRRTTESINALAPGSEIAQLVNHPIQVQFTPDGLDRSRDQVRVEIAQYAYRAGFIEFVKYFDKPKNEFPFSALRFQRGKINGAKFSGPGFIPVFIPLPVRPGNYQVRVPFYRVGEAPAGWMIIPAGPVAARQMPGSFAEQFDNWREVADDYAMGPFVTEREWYEYLLRYKEEHGLEAALRRVPKNWDVSDDLSAYRYADGRAINEMAPVTYLLYEHEREYLEHLTRSLKTERCAWEEVTFAPMNVWKRALRGNRPSNWPWGDAPPAPGLAGFRFPDPRFARSLTALPINEKNNRDLSPLSVPPSPGDPTSILITHIAGNVQHVLELSDPKEREMIANVFQMSVEALAKHFVVAGSSYRSAAPTNPDILEIFPLDSVGPWGIRPVVRLRHAAATPSISSLSI